MSGFLTDSVNIFQFFGSREAVDETRAVELVASVSCDAKPSHLKLSDKSFSESAARVIAASLREKCKSVTVADLSDIIAGKSEEEALEVLRIICDSLAECALVELNLSDNALGRPGILACQSVLCGKSLQKLYVCNDGLSAEASETLHEILIKDGMPPLKVFHFYNNMSGDGGAIAVGNIVRACPQLLDFRFSATRSRRPGCLAVAKALTTLTDLTTLDLGDCMFADEAAEHLATALGQQKALTSLNLRDAGLGEEGLLGVLAALQTGPGPQLKLLDLSGNDLEAESVPVLAKLLQGMTALEDLGLDDNAIETEGINVLTKSLAVCTSLRYVSACSCEITAAGAYVLAKTVVKLPAFRTLQLDGNAICSRGVEEVQGILLRGGMLLGDMDENDEDGDDDLEDVLEDEEGGEVAVAGGADQDGLDDLVRGLADAAIADL